MPARNEVKKKVVVAMSGGVDSSVAAALLVGQGYDVTGMMLKLWTGDCEQKENACCTPESIAQARGVANQLNIPFYVLDAKEEFKHKVVDLFIQGYQNGLTPNPCFACNQTIKWGFLLEQALQSGAEYLATGHYARLVTDEKGFTHLLKGQDEKKDQTYVLAGLAQHQFSHTMLPLGDFTKTQVRELAQKYKLTVANKPDSQDLCFVDKKGYRAFLEAQSQNQAKSGAMRTVTGEVIGEHQGLEKYTIGQRKGLGSGFAVPQYVIEKNVEQNELIVGPAEQLGTKRIKIQLINWISDSPMDASKSYEIKIRYKSTAVPCRVEKMGEKSTSIIFENKIRDATPGQIAVLYNQNEVAGSGVILSAERE
jgi:tRNA-uridine 2-sulfurtransferase